MGAGWVGVGGWRVEDIDAWLALNVLMLFGIAFFSLDILLIWEVFSVL